MTDRPPGTPRAAVLTVLPLLAAATLAACGGHADPADAVHRVLQCPALAGARAASGPPVQAVGSGSPTATTSALLRINQVGYGVDCIKQGFLMSGAPVTGAFVVAPEQGGARVFQGSVGAPVGSVNARWPYVYRLDFSALAQPGRYRLLAAGASSLPFTIGTPAALYRPLVGRAVSFFTAQRDGRDVRGGLLDRRPSHLLDAHATVYREPTYHGTQLVGRLVATGTRVDASGGWFDAGDYLKFVQTASFNEVMLLLAARDYPEAVPRLGALRAEARFGAQWLLKMWNPRQRVLYDQVGIGDGNGNSILGDHDLWRLPQADDRSRARPGAPAYFVSHRPVFAANAPGHPVSPNLAGRVAGAMGLCAQVFARTDPAFARRCLLAGQQLYAVADQHPRGLVTTQPRAYYVEHEWRDDLELGAIELYLGTSRLGGAGMLHRNPFFYLPQATDWADAYISAPTNGVDTLNLYDVSAVAHYDLTRVLRRPSTSAFAEIPGINLRTDPSALIADLRDSLALGTRLGATDAFGLANPATNVDTVPHALGYAIEVRLYEQLTGDRTFEPLAQTEIGWVLGANPWGSSFIVGAGLQFPHCLAHQVANLSGSLSGHGAILLGATVDGPNALDSLTSIGAPDGYRRCPPTGSSPFSVFDGHATGYLDDVRSSSTSEPSTDYTALALVAAAQQAEG